MFEQSLLSINGKTKRVGSMAFAFIGEIALVFGIVVIPLIWPAVIPKIITSQIIIAPSALPPAPPPPPAATHEPQANLARKSDKRVFVIPVGTITPPRKIEMLEAAPPSISDGISEVSGVNQCGQAGASPCSTNFGGPEFSSGTRTAFTPPPTPTKKVEERPSAPQSIITVGGKVQEANLVRKVIPSYPSLAKQSGIQGLVLLSAVISKDGQVRELKVLKGNPLLVPAAMDAVKQWVYNPTMLNGTAVEVRTEISVNFTLNR